MMPLIYAEPGETQIIKKSAVVLM
ncbi:hypothetical protein CIY_10930 [Butyrivibrio fibrisolvens 16/4]|nr:hypothetical protein CIY_10930 [Butyrivibrio fibrisolvens 16/4]